MLEERISTLSQLAGGAFAALIAATAAAAPFSVTYNGTISDSTFPEVINGQPYSVQLVVDNGSGSAASQTWNGPDLRCAIFTMNTAGNVSFTQNLQLSFFALDISGSMATDGSGVLTGIFTHINSINAPVPDYSFVGFNPLPPVQWYLDGINDVFYELNQNGRIFGDAAGGVSMTPGSWTNPTPFAGSCPVSGVTPIAQVPTLSEWMLMLLAGLLAISTLVALRRRS